MRACARVSVYGGCYSPHAVVHCVTRYKLDCCLVQSKPTNTLLVSGVALTLRVSRAVAAASIVGVVDRVTRPVTLPRAGSVLPGVGVLARAARLGSARAGSTPGLGRDSHLLAGIVMATANKEV